MAWGRRDRDFDDYHKPFLGRLLDDILNGLWKVVWYPIRFVAWVVYQIFIGGPYRFFRRIFDAVMGREKSPIMGHLVMGFPAFACGVGLIVLAVLVFRTSSRTIADRYRAAAKRAQEAGDNDDALLLHQRLRLIDSGNPQTTYELALLYDAKGQRDLARNLMTQIAPSDQLGLVHAHYWLAEDLASRRTNSKDIELARAHLLRVLSSYPDHPQSNILLAQFDWESGRISEAERHLLTAAARDPLARLILADLLNRIPDRKNDARRQATLARDEFVRNLRVSADDHASRRALISAHIILDEMPDALTVVQQGEALFPDRGYTKQIARILLTWAARTPKDDPARWKRFGEAFAKAPTDAMVLGRLLKTALDDPGDEASLRVMLAPARLNEKTELGANLVLGLLGIHRGKSGEGMAILESVAKKSPEGEALARQIVMSSPLNPTSGLDLATSLAKVWPNSEAKQFHAEWLLRAGKPQEALIELEQISADRKMDPRYFGLLAEACQRVGLFEKANAYRIQAAGLAVVSRAPTVPKEQTE